MVTLTWHACKQKVHKLHQRYILKLVSLDFSLRCQLRSIAFNASSVQSLQCQFSFLNVQSIWQCSESVQICVRKFMNKKWFSRLTFPRCHKLQVCTDSVVFTADACSSAVSSFICKYFFSVHFHNKCTHLTYLCYERIHILALKKHTKNPFGFKVLQYA